MVDRESAMVWLRKEDERWRNPLGDEDAEEAWKTDEHNLDGIVYRYMKKHRRWPAGGALFEDALKEDLGKAVRPAFGFWVFPVEALGPLDSGHPDGRGFAPRKSRMLDLREYWPELWLANLQ